MPATTFAVLQELQQLAGTLGMKQLSIIQTDFDVPAGDAPALPAGWQSLRQFVKVEHPQSADTIDKVLRDEVNMQKPANAIDAEGVLLVRACTPPHPSNYSTVVDLARKAGLGRMVRLDAHLQSTLSPPAIQQACDYNCSD